MSNNTIEIHLLNPRRPVLKLNGSSILLEPSKTNPDRLQCEFEGNLFLVHLPAGLNQFIDLMEVDR